MKIKAAASADVDELERIYALSFESNAPFFPDDMEEEDGDADDDLSFSSALSLPNKTVLTIWKDDHLIGGALISRVPNQAYLLERMFILPEEQGKGYGHRAWIEIEKTLPCPGGWILRTPTCLINNVCFYVNKCGFSIIRVEDMGRDGVGMYVFTKAAI
ncbi:GNAT family N-acetyltransferase [Pseudomonas japonica]|uniref:GNAT family N-acetyltransferase n=1 Tax=Pseudomonas japonica TaxID=256466 RepID=UPI003A83A65A